MKITYDIPNILTVNGKPYTLIRLLGKGKGGYSWLAKDKAGTEYVLKQLHHEPCDYYQFGDKFQSEINDYRRLKEIGIPLPRLIDADADRERILKEYIPGETVFELVQADRMRDDYLRQIRDICGILYANGLNIDYFPTNFVAKSGHLFNVDYECNGYMPEWDFEHWGIRYWSKTKEFQEYEKTRGLRMIFLNRLIAEIGFLCNTISKQAKSL